MTEYHSGEVEENISIVNFPVKAIKMLYCDGKEQCKTKERATYEPCRMRSE
jgi:hypothetical protein